MPEAPTKTKSRYALKVERGSLERSRASQGIVRAHRECSFCHRPLVGRRGHGFPSHDGRKIACGGCKKP